MSIRDKFVEDFDETTAKAIEKAAEEHKNGVHDRQGSDPFKWALLIAIGYQCMELDDYRTYHKIKPEFKKLKEWIKKYAELETHDGDVDFVSLFAGIYNEYMPTKVEV